jgi:hypothetical protein
MGTNVGFVPVVQDETASGRLGGTSFSSPQVAGVAALLRAAVPSLRAIETKAILLASARDIESKNLDAPWHSRNAYGAGLAYASRAVNVLEAQAYGRGTVSPAAMTWSGRLSVVPGRWYRLAATWMRQVLTSAAWSNLDIEVLDSANVVLAASATPRNLYEFCTFSTQASQVTLRVSAKSLDGPQQEFGWALSETERPWVMPLLEEYGAGCPGSAASLDGIVLPPSARLSFGNTQVSQPFGGGGGRYQQIFAGVQRPAELVMGLALRPDDTWAAAESVCSADIYVGATNLTPQTLGIAFDSNWKSPPVKVFSGAIRLPERLAPSINPSFFRPAVLFQALPLHDWSQGNLLVEVRSQGGGLHQVDAVTGRSTETAQLFGGYAASWGQVTVGKGLVIKLITSLTIGAGGVPELYGTLSPLSGADTTTVLSGGRRSAAVALALGGSDQQWGVLPLPLDLSSLGAAGCKLLAAPDIVSGLVLDSVGYGEARLRIPSNPAFVGTSLYQQGLVQDPPANALGLALTNGLHYRVGGFR